MNFRNSRSGRGVAAHNSNPRGDRSIALAVRGTVEALESRQLLSSVATWHFDEATGHNTAADASGNSHTATLHGGADFIQARGGQALSLDGSSGWASVAHDSGIDLTGAVTVAGWVKLDGNEQDQKILGTESGSAGGYKLGFYDGKLEFEVRDQNNQYYLDRWTPGGVDLRDGQWHFVAGVYDQAAGYIQTYVDGQLNRELITGGSLVASGHDLVIGRETFDNSNYFHGQIADLAVDDTALSAQQIGDRYTAPTAVHVQALGGTAMRVSWLNGGAASGGYKVEYRAQGASTWTSAGTTASSATALMIDGLTTGTTYEAQVTALYGFNSTGTPSATVPITTGATDETGYYKVSGVNGETTIAMQTGITAGAATSSGLSVIGDGIVYAADWKEAVYKALSGAVTVSSPASTAGTYAFGNNGRYVVDIGGAIGSGSVEGSLAAHGLIGATAQAVGFEDYADFDHNDWLFPVKAEQLPISVSITPSDPDGSEDGRDTFSFTFARGGSNLPEGDVSIEYSVSGDAQFSLEESETGISRDGGDYTGLPAPSGLTPTGVTFTIIIPSGSLTKHLELTPLNDSEDEPSESVQVHIERATLDGRPLTIETADASGSIKNARADFTISTPASPQDITEAESQIENLHNENAPVREHAIEVLTDLLIHHSELSSLYEQRRTQENVDPETATDLGAILTANPDGLIAELPNNTLGVQVPPIHPDADHARLNVISGDRSILEIDDSIQGVGVDFDGSGHQEISTVPMRSGATHVTLVFKWFDGSDDLIERVERDITVIVSEGSR